MSSSEHVDRRPTVRQGVVLTDDSAATLAALGAAFDDLLLLDDAELDQLATLGAETVVVVDGALSARAREAVCDHVATRPGACLALAAPAADVTGDEFSGLRILGSGHLGALPVIWWGAADAVIDVATLNHPARPATPLQEDADAAFVAGAHARRAARGPRLSDAALRAGERLASPQPLPVSDPAPPRRAGTARSSLGTYRALLVVALLVCGAAIGALVAEILGDGDVALGLVLAAVAALVLVTVWQVRTTRLLAGQLGALSDRTTRMERDLGKQVRQLSRRAETSDAKLQRARERLRQVEARLAIVSTASVNFERSRSRSRAAETPPHDSGRASD